MAVTLDDRWQVRMETTLLLPLSNTQLWNSLQEFERFVCIDLFHCSAVLDEQQPSRGVGLSIQHRFLFVSLQRVGRILWWREKVGFAFSDLSKRNSRSGFPHMYSYLLIPQDNQCRVVLRINGRWTARSLPRFLILLWLRWVFAHIRFNLEREMFRVLRVST